MLLLLDVITSLKRRLASTDVKYIMTINWKLIEEEVAGDFHCGIYYIRDLRKDFLCNGEVYAFGREVRGQGSEGGNISSNQKVTAIMLKHLATMVGEVHTSGKAVLVTDVIAF